MNNDTKAVDDVMLSKSRKIASNGKQTKNNWAGDLAILNLNQWASMVKQFEEILKDIKMSATLYTSILVVPPVDQWYKLIKEYHESAVGGHRGINKSYSKIAKDFYWRNMRPDDWLTKYIVLAPVQKATAEETVRALMDEFIPYFGAPEKLLREVLHVGRILVPYHPQSNGAIKRMHHVLTKYLKAYVSQTEKWDEVLPLCALAYNTSEHESTGYSPYELVFDQRAKLPSSFKQPEKGHTYTALLEQITENLTQLRTLAAMTQTQHKYKSKY
ncbi:uncharacterized protein LOC106645042 [Copidosoma floridanum]|uniref:uncharacterized protein LOC106645042 n=1 Tax=Copidosoma floridanum TaxID=29053 RepID=UPI0006C97630|nr:uncharacterized protein LOC106645042 [Copidosoma floridanum]